MPDANIQAYYLLSYSIKANLLQSNIVICFKANSADLHFWYNVLVLTAAFSINFLAKSLILNFLKI